MRDSEELKCAIAESVETTILSIEEMLAALRVIQKYYTQLPDGLSKKANNTLFKMSEKLYDKPWYWDGMRMIDGMLAKIMRHIPEETDKNKDYVADKIASLESLAERMRNLRPSDSNNVLFFKIDSLHDLDKYIAKCESFM